MVVLKSRDGCDMQRVLMVGSALSFGKRTLPEKGSRPIGSGRSLSFDGFRCNSMLGEEEGALYTQLLYTKGVEYTLLSKLRPKT